MRIHTIVTLGALSTLLFAVACSAGSTDSGTGAPTDPPDATPPVTPSKADASVPDAATSADTKTCGGFAFGSSACGVCAKGSCCAEAAACEGSADCRALLACVEACSDSTCIADCTTANPGGLQHFTPLGACTRDSCATECSTTPKTSAGSRGIGDPCTSSSDCHDGTCNASPGETGWCTTSCATNLDCAGYPQLNNQSGHFSFCLQTNAGSSQCFPGCSATSDCAKYGSGLSCKTVGNGVNVCSL